jgi:NAD+ synthase (glutamine-hydrolysing)
MEQRLYHARRPHCPLVYVNLCGANDELIFDGRSFALDAQGHHLATLPGFEEAVRVVDLATARPAEPPEGPAEKAALSSAGSGRARFRPQE